MGTSTNQIATRANIDSGKRKNTYYKTISAPDDLLKKCPTKGEINQIEFLDVKNASTSVTNKSCNYNSQTDDRWSACLSIGSNGAAAGSATNPGTKYCNTNYNYGLICYMKNTISHNSTTSLLNVNFSLDRSDLINNTNDKTFIMKASLFYHNITVTPGKPTKLDFDLGCIGYAYTTPAQATFPNSTGQSYICNYDETNSSQTCRFSIVVLDGNDECIFISDYSFSNYSSSSALSHMTPTINITPTTSSVTAYIIPSYLYMYFYPKVSGNLYVAAGFESSINVTTYDSYYDDDCKLAQYEDIGIDSARRFGVYYGVWNNKDTPARVDYARALINTTANGTASGWTQIGQVTLSDIAGNGTRSGVITCTLPTNIDLGAQQYYLVIKVGDTLNDQDFSGGWGNAKEDVSYKYCRKSTSGWTNAIPLTPISETYTMNGEIYDTLDGEKGVLNSIALYDGNAEFVTGVYNTNPEYKGWIMIT